MDNTPSSSSTTTFPEWLRAELRERDRRPAWLAHRAGMDEGTLSNILKGKRNPGKVTLDGIAKALDVPPAVVYQAAGFLPAETEVPQALAEVNHLVAQLDPETQDEILDVIRVIYERRSKHRNSKPKVDQPARVGQPQLF